VDISYYKIRKIRMSKDMTLKELSDRCGVSPSFISDIEHGRRKPSDEYLRKIAQGLNVSVDDLVLDKDNNLEDEDTSELKILFDKIRDLSEDDKKRINAIVEAFKKENQD